MFELESNGERSLVKGIPESPKQQIVRRKHPHGIFFLFFPGFKESFVIFVVLDVEINVEFSWQIRKKNKQPGKHRVAFF